MNFTIESDLEFYCFLKARLPEEFTIVSEPSPAYYSEWLFHYKICRGSELFQEFQGDFRTIERGSLVKEAKRIIREAGGRVC